MFYLDQNHVYRSDLLDGLPGVRHGFGTAHSAGWLEGESVATLRQVHSATVLVADGPAGLIGEGDGLITRRRQIFVSIRTADCVPILLADVEQHAVAAVHAGWRGTAAEIVRNAVTAMQREFHTEPGSIYAAIGPAIGVCCYEVGPEVASQFGTLFPEWDTIVHSGTIGHIGTTGQTKTRLDLVEANRRQLVAAGLPASQIDAANLCTACDREFHSYRRDREAAGRQVSAIELAGENA